VEPVTSGEHVGTVDISGLRIGFTQRGSGPAVVLVHGYVGEGLATWRPQLDALSAEFTVVVLDLPGVGGSSDPPEDFGIGGYADVLAAFIDALQLDRPHVVGLSFGGTVALELNRRHPHVAASLVLVSAYAGWLGSLTREAAEQRLEQAVRLSRLSPDEFVGALLPTMFAEGTSPATVEEFGESMRRFHPDGFRAMARACFVDARDALDDVRVPTLVVHGELDTRAPRAVADGLHAAIVGSSLTVLPGAGHLCNLEVPDLFNDAIATFSGDCRGPRAVGQRQPTSVQPSSCDVAGPFAQVGRRERLDASHRPR
jgi:pimeloyl-ACP methyl ester carboxylesterase